MTRVSKSIELLCLGVVVCFVAISNIHMLLSLSGNSFDIAVTSENEGDAHYACSDAARASYRRLVDRSGLFDFFNEKNATTNFQCNCFEASRNGHDFVFCLPTFFVAGVPKSGTSSLYYYLLKDPRIICPASKEYYHTLNPIPDWMNSDLKEPRRLHRLRRYIQSFSQKAILQCPVGNSSVPRREGCELVYANASAVAAVVPRIKDGAPGASPDLQKKEEGRKIGAAAGSLFMIADGTPEYHMYADTPTEIHSWFPTARVVFILRDTVGRAVSSYRFSRLGGDIDPGGRNMTHFLLVARQHHEQLQACRGGQVNGGTVYNWRFHERGNSTSYSTVDRVVHSPNDEVYQKYEQLKRNLSMHADPCLFQPFIRQHCNFFARASLAEHLKWWLQFFLPHQLLVIDFHRLRKDPHDVVKQTLSFLNLSASPRLLRDSLVGVRYAGPADAVPIQDTFFTRLSEKIFGFKTDYSKLFNKTKSDQIAEIEALFRPYDHLQQMRTIRKMGVKCVF